MVRFIIKRILIMIPVFIGVLIIVFTLNFFMPGDPVVDHLPDNYTQEMYDEVEHQMGLDRPYVVQLADYIWGVFTRFDLGTSYSSNQPVRTMIGQRVWVSVKIGLLGTLLVVIIGIPVGVLSALKQNSIADYSITTFSIVLASMPGFWLALVSIILFSLKLRLLPASGLASWKHYILPVVCNSLMTLASITRMTRSSMLEVIRQDYVRTARSKGLKEGEITVRHTLKNALIPVVTTVGGQMGMVIGGSVIIETIFSIPGMGSLMVTAINQRDYPLILGITVIISIFTCVMNLIVDLVYSFIDPRIKSQFAGKPLFSGKEKKKTSISKEA